MVLPGCNALATTFGGGPERTVDAHVIYRLRTDCSTLLARSLRNGYSVMTPLTAGFEAEETGLFEGPVREGQSIFRYYPPSESQQWSDRWTEVSVDVQAVQLELRPAREALDAVCGPLVEGEASDAIPRLPDDQNR
ncbi:MAG: hypothetical protein AAF170_16815 [Bacteroidota bacterium]